MAVPSRFGLSTHLFHTRQLTHDDITRVRDAGFPLLELFATRTHLDYHDPRALDTLRGWLAADGVDVWSVHLPITEGIHDGVWGQALSNASTETAIRELALSETTTAIAAAGALGANVVVLHLGVPEEHARAGTDNDESAAARILDPIVDACSEARVRLAVEVIPNRLSTASAVASWLDRDMLARRAGACLDVGHAHMTGGVVDAIETLGGTIITTHLHDNRGTSDEHLLPFKGTINWPAVLQALVKTGYDGPLMFELPDHGDVAATLAAAADARDRITAILGDLAAPFPFEE